MNKGKYIIFFSGFVAGGITGAGVAFLFLKKKFDKRIDEELEKINSEMSEEDVAYFEGETKVNIEDLDSTPAPTLNDISKKYASPKAEEMDYKNFYSKKEESADPAESEHPEEEDDEENENETDPESIGVITPENENLVAGYQMTKEMAYSKDKKPKIITGDSFYNEYPHFDKISLQYYFDDDILATEEDEEIDDVERVLGDTLDKYGFRNNDESVIYVRNLSMGTDYEVFKVRAAFGEYTQR